MIDEVYNAFLDEYRRQEEAGWSNIAVEGITGFIFINKEDRLMNKQNVNRAIERIRIACNENSLRSKDRPVIIPHFSSHHIRHTFCSGKACLAQKHCAQHCCPENCPELSFYHSFSFRLRWCF